jgi:hypothetical protein
VKAERFQKIQYSRAKQIKATKNSACILHFFFLTPMQLQSEF